MAVTRENVHVGWIDANGRLWTTKYEKHQSVEGMTKVFARIGPEKNDGMHCQWCLIYIGYGSSRTVHGKTTCPQCERRAAEAGTCDCYQHREDA